MKILLILPYDSTYRYRGFFRRSISYAPLTLTVLAALVPLELNARIDIWDEGVMPPLTSQEVYDVVGITAVASSAPCAYELCAHWKSRGAYVVMGGPHATLMPEEAIRHADTVCLGPGERTWPQFLRDWRDGCPGKFYRGQPEEPFTPPLPRRDLLPGKRYMPIPTIEAGRGCVNRCEFCSIHAFGGGARVVRPVEDVVHEIRAVGGRRLIFLDPNLYADRDYACRLFEALIPLGLKWSGLSTADSAEDTEFVDLMARSGCNGLLIGFESLDQGALHAVGKMKNETSRYKLQVENLHRHNIAVLGCFVLGFDADTRESLSRSLTDIETLGLDLVRFAVLTPFPGTPLFGRLEREGRILTRDWSRYDCETVVFQPAHMHPDALQDALMESWRGAYGLRAVARRVFSGRSERFWRFAANWGFRFYAKRLCDRANLGH